MPGINISSGYQTRRPAKINPLYGEISSFQRVLAQRAPQCRPEISFREIGSGLGSSIFDHEIMQRVLASAIAHWNFSASASDAGSAVKAHDIPGTYRANCAYGLGQLLFTGTLKDNGEIARVTSMRLTGSGKIIDSLETAADAFGIGKNPDSLSFLNNCVEHYNRALNVNAALKENASEVIGHAGLKAPGSVPELISSGGPQHAAFINHILEATMSERHTMYYAFVNNLPEQYRQPSLEPVRLLRIWSPACYASHIQADGSRVCLAEDGGVNLFVHPFTREVLGDIPLRNGQKLFEDTVYYPGISGRSGFVMDPSSRWRGHYLKVELPVMMSGWMRVFGQYGVEEEVETTKFFGYNSSAGHTAPAGISLLLTTEGASVSFENGLRLAAMARPLPENLKNSVLLPAAYLTAQDPFSGEPLIQELTKGMDKDRTMKFFRERIIAPYMAAWDYFLSLKGVPDDVLGIAPELHGQNAYFVWDADEGTISPRMVFKDFTERRILFRDKAPAAKISQEYDHFFGHLFLEPLIGILSRVQNISEQELFDEVNDSFVKLISPENRAKFVNGGRIAGYYQDSFPYLAESPQSERKNLWTTAPLARPGVIGAYG